MFALMQRLLGIALLLAAAPFVSRFASEHYGPFALALLCPSLALGAPALFLSFGPIVLGKNVRRIRRIRRIHRRR